MCSRVYTVHHFRTVFRYFRLVLVISVACVCVCTCSKQRDMRQIMASHHGRENCLMKNVRPIEILDNKVEREENRDLAIKNLSLKILILFICVFTQRFNLPTFNIRCIDDDPRNFWLLFILKEEKEKESCTILSWNYRVFWRRNASKELIHRHEIRTFFLSSWYVCHYGV